MGREKLFLALAGLSVFSSGCVHNGNRSDCNTVQKVVGKYRFRSCKESLDDMVLKEFELVAGIKDYGKKTFGFGNTPNYTEYRDGKYLPKETHYRLYVSPKDMLPEKWKNFEYVGEDSENRDALDEPTIFWSKTDNLRDELEFYSNGGYETYWRSYNNYGSGCGLTPDLMATSLEWKVSVILHEDWHYNFGRWQSDKEPNVDESAASFVGFVGAADFIKSRYGLDSEEYGFALKQVESRYRHAKFFNKYYRLLRVVFDSGLSEKRKGVVREHILKQAALEYRPTSVMEIWNELPYTKNFVLLWDVYQKQGKDMGKMKKILRRLPGKEKAAVRYLRRFL